MPDLNFVLHDVSADTFTVRWTATPGVQYYIKWSGTGDIMYGDRDLRETPKMPVPMGSSTYTVQGITRNFYRVELYEGGASSAASHLVTRVDKGIVIIEDEGVDVYLNFLLGIKCCEEVGPISFSPNAGGCHTFNLPTCPSTSPEIFQYFVAYKKEGEENYRIQRFKAGVSNKVGMECFTSAIANSGSYNESDSLSLIIIPIPDHPAFYKPPFESLWMKDIS